MDEHSRYYSPSSISRRIGCTMSALLEDGVVDKKVNPAADYGTYGHWMAEKYLQDGVPVSSHLGSEGFGQVCDQELVNCVEEYISDVNRVLLMYESFTDQYMGVEQQVSMAGYGMPEVFGTADLIIDEMFGVLTVLDLKTGSGVNVEPENNKQLMTYGLACAGSEESLMSYERIRLAISQPRAKTKGKSLKVWEVEPQVLLDFLNNELRPCYNDIQAGVFNANPTDGNCMWCKGKDKCEAFSGKALEVAQNDFGIIAPKVNEKLVNKVYPNLKILKSFIKQVEAKAFELASLNKLNGFKVVNGRKSRSWSDIGKAKDILGDDFYEKKEISPAKAEKILGKDGKAKIQDLISVGYGKPVIAPESDKREAISTVEGFDKIEE